MQTSYVLLTSLLLKWRLHCKTKWVADPALRTSSNRAGHIRGFDGRGKAKAVAVKEHRRRQQAVGRLPVAEFVTRLILHSRW